MYFTNMGSEKYFWFFLASAVSFIIAKFFHLIIRNSLDKKIGKKNSKIVARIFQYLIIVVGIELGLYYILNVQLSSLVTTLGVAGVIIGIASQQIIQNLLAGILISIERPIEVEDWVEIGGFPKTGISRVRNISLTRTTLRALDGQLVHVPNSMLIMEKVVNYTTAGFVRDRAEITIQGGSDFMKIKKIILKIAKNNDRILPNVSTLERKETLKILKLLKIKKYFERKVDMNRFVPRVIITNLNDGKMSIEIEYWIREIKNSNYIKSELLRELNEELKKVDIAMV